MKNILIIAYYYPPKGGAGVQRTAKFANYLSKFGYKVHVLTVKENTAGLVDLSIYKEINNSITIYRTDIKETNLLNSIMNLMKRTTKNKNSSEKEQTNDYKLNLKSKIKDIFKTFFLNLYSLAFIPDDKKGWIQFAVDQGKKIIKENDIDLIFTTSAPYSTHIIGYKLVSNIKVKWVADFRDPWASNPFSNYNFVLQSIYNHLENKVVKKSNRIISVSKPIIEDFIKRYPNENNNKFVVIPNGYDEEDFAELDLEISKHNSKFTILYNGTLYGKRSPETILSVIESLIAKEKIDKNKIQIRFIGEIGNTYMRIIKYYSNKYPGVVVHKSYIPHKESLFELCKANALLLIIDEGRGSEGIYTGKLFEYIRVGKTILGVVPEGVAKDLIDETNTGYTALPSNEIEIENIIVRAYNDFINCSNTLLPNNDKIKEYSRENLTKKLIKEIESIL